MLIWDVQFVGGGSIRVRLVVGGSEGGMGLGVGLFPNRREIKSVVFGVVSDCSSRSIGREQRYIVIIRVNVNVVYISLYKDTVPILDCSLLLMPTDLCFCLENNYWH